MSEFDLSKIKEFYNRIPEIWAPDDAWHTYSHHELDHYIKQHMNLFEDKINIEEKVMYKLDLQEIIDELSFKQRLIFEEIVLKGNNMTQTAKKFNISVQAVSKTYKKMIRVILKYLQKE